MANVPNNVETLPIILIAGVGRTNVTDRQTTRQTTDGRTRTTTYSEHERKFTFAKTGLVIIVPSMEFILFYVYLVL